MFVKALQLRDFRNYEQVSIAFSPRVNVIAGANAQGKTALLEALYLCIAGRSFRTSQISDLVRYEQPHFHVETRFNKNTVDQRIRITYGEGERKILYNSTTCQSATSLLGVLPGVSMTSEDIGLIRGSPQMRRHFLDIQIAQTDPLYLHHLTRYQRAMRQRNQLLRQRSTSTINTWEEEMAHSAAYLVQGRTVALRELGEHAQQRYHKLSHGAERFGLEYKSGAPFSGSFTDLKLYYQKQFLEQRGREMQLGMTLSGPHRDDLALTLNEREARSYASEGQQRSCVTALRLAEYDRIRELSGIPPLLLIDDVGISLDAMRLEKLFDQVLDLGQVFLTNASDLSRYFPKDAQRSFSVAQGTVQAEEA